MKYSIKITYKNGTVAYMSDKDRTAWCKRTAQKHLREWVHLHGITAELVPAEQLSNGGYF